MQSGQLVSCYRYRLVDRAAVPEVLAPTWVRAFRYHTGKPHLFLLSGSGASAHTLPVRWAFMRVSNVLLSKIRERTPSPGPLAHSDFVFEGMLSSDSCRSSF